MITEDDFLKSMRKRLDHLVWQKKQIFEIIKDSLKRSYGESVVTFDFQLHEAKGFAENGKNTLAGESLSQAKTCLDDIALYSILIENDGIYNTAKARYDKAFKEIDESLWLHGGLS